MSDNRTTTPAPTTAVATTAAQTPAIRTMEFDARGGIKLRNIEDLRWFCEQASKSGLVPEHFRNKSADIMIAVQWGYEINVSPIQALQNIAVIKGRASIWGDLVLAILQARRDVIEYVLEDDPNDITRTGKATCRIKRVGYPRETVVTYTKEMAATAGLLAKDTYKQHLGRMLQMRARAFCARNAAADLLKGFEITEQIREEMDARDITPGVTQPAPFVNVEGEVSGAVTIDTTATPVADAAPRTTRRLPRAAAPAPAPEPEPPPVEVQVESDDCRMCAAPLGEPHEEDCTACTDCGAIPGEEHDADCDTFVEQQRRAQRTPVETARAAAAANPAPVTAAPPLADGETYIPPVAPTVATDRCNKAAKLRGKTIYTAGISNVTLMKVESFVARFDKAHYAGSSLDALDIVVGEGVSVPDWFHLSEEQGRAFAEYLNTHMNDANVG